MEVKKSYEADLEHQWKKRFLLGLVLVLAVLVVALELNFRDGAVEYNEELLDDIVQELELKAAVDQEDMIAVMEEPEEEPAEEADEGAEAEPEQDAAPEKTEAEIERLDGEIERVSALLATEEVASNYERLIELTNELEQLNSEQEKQYEIWEELSD